MSYFDEKIKFDMYGTFDSTKSHLKSKSISPYRKVKCFEVELFEDDFSYTEIDGQQYSLTKNTVIIAVPGNVRNSKLHFKCRFLHLSINDEWLRKLFYGLSHRITVSDYGAYLNCFERIFYHNAAAEPLLAMSEVYRLLSFLVRDDKYTAHFISAKTDCGINGIIMAANFMEENYSQNLSLYTIAKQAFLSPNYFHKKFTDIYGKTPLAYLTDIRIAKAKLLLLETEKSVTEVTFLCGFNSQPYFNYVFKKQCGITPLKYRERPNKNYRI